MDVNAALAEFRFLRCLTVYTVMPYLRSRAELLPHHQARAVAREWVENLQRLNEGVEFERLAVKIERERLLAHDEFERIDDEDEWWVCLDFTCDSRKSACWYVTGEKRSLEFRRCDVGRHAVNLGERDQSTETSGATLGDTTTVIPTTKVVLQRHVFNLGLRLVLLFRWNVHQFVAKTEIFQGTKGACICVCKSAHQQLGASPKSRHPLLTRYLGTNRLPYRRGEFLRALGLAILRHRLACPSLHFQPPGRVPTIYLHPTDYAI